MDVSNTSFLKPQLVMAFILILYKCHRYFGLIISGGKPSQTAFTHMSTHNPGFYK